MKWMRKLRLINWHYFQDEMMEFGPQTLITGRNAAGKSTIIDALQLLLIADQRKIRFNSAAHEDAKRSLIHYLRGKKGTEEQAYLREGAFTSFVVAEFEDTKKREPFVVGVVIDVHVDNQTDEEFFILTGSGLAEINFLTDENRLLNREQFKQSFSNKGTRVQFERNKALYQKRLLTRMGHLQDRFFSIFTKALSFKPIQNVKDFVYDYILDRKELQLDLLKQNFDIHQQYKKELNDLQERKEQLEQIFKQYEQYTMYRDRILTQEYVVRRLQYEQKGEELEETEQYISSMQSKLQSKTQDLENKNSQWQEAQNQVTEAYNAWQSHELKAEQESLKKQIKELAEEIYKKSRNFRTFQDQILEERRMIENLLEWEENEYWQWGEGERDHLMACANLLAELLEEQESPVWWEMESRTEEVFKIGDTLADLQNRFTKATGRLEDRVTELTAKYQGVQQEIEDLEKQKRPYSSSLRTLKKLLGERLAGRSEVWVFCEQVEVLDESWRDALEGYLNTQRFDLLVEPEFFAEALSIYEREKKTYQLEGIGLVDTEKEKKHLGNTAKGSLAEELKTSNPVMQARIDHLLGQVMKAVDEQELRRHRTAVTPSCMSYHNLVARQIPKRVYEVPYLGSKAIEKLLEIKRKELKDLEAELHQVDNLHRVFVRWQKRLGEKRSHYQRLADHLSLPVELEKMMTSQSELKTKLEKLDLSEVDRLKTVHDQLKALVETLSQEVQKLAGEKATTEKELGEKQSQKYLLQKAKEEAYGHWQSWQNEYPIELLPRAEERWSEAIRDEAPAAKKIVDWTRSQTSHKTQRDRAFQELTQLRQAYNLKYTMNADINAESNQDYQVLLASIQSVDIPEYTRKLEDALRQSEEEFQSHFVYKMREAIQMAKLEFDRLNAALQDFPFHTDKYRFSVEASEKYRKFYKVIMDPNMIERGTLFDHQDPEKEAALHELFNHLVSDEEEDRQTFTDYRQYLDFDLIIESHGERFSFSKVLKEKSGGETQTPFYIAILASFNHLYAQNTSRLVIFDEAFNKMDEERIQQALRLIKQMGLQLIAAVPDEKMLHMAPEVSTTLVVNRDGYHCFVDMIEKLDRTSITEEDDDQYEQGNLQEQGSLFAPDQV